MSALGGPGGTVSPGAYEAAGTRHGRRQRDRHVAEDADRLHRRLRAFRDRDTVVDPQHDVEIAVAPQRHVADVPDAHAGEQHRLSLLEVLSPGEARVERIARLQTAAHEPQRPEDEDDDRDRDENADGDFVATFHVWRKGASTHRRQRVEHENRHRRDDDRARRRPPDALGAGLGNVTLIGADERDRDAEHRRLEQAVDHLERAEAEPQAFDEIRGRDVGDVHRDDVRAHNADARRRARRASAA